MGCEAQLVLKYLFTHTLSSHDFDP